MLRQILYTHMAGFMFAYYCSTICHHLSSSSSPHSFGVAVHAQLTNDLCINARPVEIGARALKLYARGISVDADVQDCISGDNPIFPGAWFSFIGNGERVVGRSCYAIFMSIYQNGCDPNTAACVAATRSPCASERFIFDTVNGTKYHVLLQMDTSTPDRLVEFSLFNAPLVVNDFCIDATPLVVGSTLKVNTTYALSDTKKAEEFCLPPNTIIWSGVVPGVWYTIVGTGETIVATAYRACITFFVGGCDISTRKCVSGEAASCNSKLIVDSTLGTVYHILLQSSSEYITEFSILAFSRNTNDYCINARPFTLGSTLQVNTTYATVDVNVKSDCVAHYGWARKEGVWFNFTGTGERFVARSCNPSYVYEKAIIIYRGECNSLVCVAGTTRHCDRARFVFDTIQGEKYYVLFEPGIGTFDLSIFPLPLVPNDSCIDAQALPLEASVLVNTTYALNDIIVEQRCIGNVSGVSFDPGIWYYFTGTGDRLVARACYGARLSVFQGRCDPTTRKCVRSETLTNSGASQYCDEYLFETTRDTIYHVLVVAPSDVRPTDNSTGTPSLLIFPFVAVRGDTCMDARAAKSDSIDFTYATDDDDSMNCVFGEVAPGIWYKFTGTGKRHVARSCYSNFISIYTGGCDASTLTCIAVTASTCSRERFVFDTVLGVEYYVLVQYKFRFRPTSIPTRLHEFSVFPLPLVSNDACSAAIQMRPGTFVTVDTTYALFDTEIRENCYDGSPPDYPGLWFTFIGTGERFVVRLCDTGFAISIFEGGCDAASRKCIGGSQNPCNFVFDTTDGAVYYALVESATEEMMTFGLYSYHRPIANDQCINASPLSSTGVNDVVLRDALPDANEVSDTCGGYMSFDKPGVWYNFTGTGNQVVIRYACRSFDSTDRAYIAIYRGECGPSSLVCAFVGFLGCRTIIYVFQPLEGVAYHLLAQGPNFFGLKVSGLISNLAPSAVPVSVPTQHPPPVSASLCPTARVSNGEIILGMNCLGYLIDRMNGVGLQFSTSNATYEALARGSAQIEGWGISATDFLSTKSFAGYSNLLNEAETSLRVESFISNATEAISVVSVSGGTLEVTHHYKPSPYTPSLYECTVTLKNIGTSTMTDLRYRRTVGWVVSSDNAKTCIDIVGVSKDLQCASNHAVSIVDPRISASVNASSTFFKCENGMSPCPVINYGPADQGADFVFYLNETDGVTPIILLSGESTAFKIYYGAMKERSIASSIMERLPTSEAINVYSLAYGPDSVSGGCVSSGEPATFIFGFSAGAFAVSPTLSPIVSSPTAVPVTRTNLPELLTKIVNDTADKIGDYVDESGNANEDLKSLTIEVRKIMNDLSSKGLSISRRLSDKDILLPLMFSVPNIKNRRHLQEDCPSSLDCDLLLGKLIADVLALALSIVPGLATLEAGAVLARTIGKTIAEKALKGSVQKTVMQLTLSFDDGLSNVVKLGRLVYDTIAGISFDQLLGVLSDSFGNLSLEVATTTSLSVLAGLLAIVASGGTVTLAAIALNVGVGTYNLVNTIQAVQKTCPDQNCPPVKAPSQPPMLKPPPLPPPVKPPMSPPVRPPMTPTRDPPSMPFPPPPRGFKFSSVATDPHITTLDGLNFDCQARGEFTMLESLDSMLLFQSRFTKASVSGLGRTASVTSGIAIRESGAPTIQISFQLREVGSLQECLGLIMLYENGIQRPLNTGALSSNATVLVLKENEISIVFLETGLEIRLLVTLSSSFGCFFSYLIAIPKDYRANETMTGLLGNANGNPADDWQTRLGETLPTPDTESALYQAGYDYCRTEWCVRSAADSLFTYEVDESFATFFNCDAPYKSDIADAVAAASQELRNVCGTSIECIVDGIVGEISDAQILLDSVGRIEQAIVDINRTYTFNESSLTTGTPTKAPTISSTKAPTAPLTAPTIAPTVAPRTAPTITPGAAPTTAPINAPMITPTAPRAAPTIVPVTVPTVAPRTAPTITPRGAPTIAPTVPRAAPTIAPRTTQIIVPTTTPTNAPIKETTVTPKIVPTIAPSIKPTAPKPCGLFGASIFCPIVFLVRFGSWIRKLFGLSD